jgi:hypothetical protein
MTWRVMPAISEGSPRPRRWSLGRNQFQHFAAFVTGLGRIDDQAGLFFSIRFMRVPAAKSSGD